MYIESIHIENFRCFDEADVRFLYPDRKTTTDAPLPALGNINLILGNNGTGKTTVLKAIALSLLSPIIESAGYVPYHLVRRMSKGVRPLSSAEITSRVVLHGQDVASSRVRSAHVEELAATITRIHSVERIKAVVDAGKLWNEMYRDESPAFLIVGYGATRRVESSETFDKSARSKRRLLRYQRVAGLFEDHVTLTPLNAWLPDMRSGNPGRYTQVVDLINRLLPEGTRFLAELEEGEYLFEHNSVPIPFGALSDGYRAYIGWIADLLYHVCMGCPSGAKLVDNRGIVLVDEIDLHLHPEWQRTVVATLSRTLPNLQFILSSHSPIVTGTLHSSNIFMVEQAPSGASRIRQIEEHVHGLNADQILQSSYFNLATTRAPGVVDEMRVLAQRAWEGDTGATIDFLRLLTSGTESSDNAHEAASNGGGHVAESVTPMERATSVPPVLRHASGTDTKKSGAAKGATSKISGSKAGMAKVMAPKGKGSKATPSKKIAGGRRTKPTTATKPATATRKLAVKKGGKR